MISEGDISTKTVSVVVFEVNGEQFAIDLVSAREIVQKGQIRRLPQTYDYVEGIYSYRGDIIYVINLSKKLHLDEYKALRLKNDEEEVHSDSTMYIIIVTINSVNTGFLVDRIINISHVKDKDIVGLSPILETSVSMEYIKGIVKFEDRPRVLLNVEKILTETEQANLQKELIK